MHEHFGFRFVGEMVHSQPLARYSVLQSGELWKVCLECD
jgi:hypothetical protein